jgi:hypothetical protein
MDIINIVLINVGEEVETLINENGLKRKWPDLKQQEYVLAVNRS